MKKVEIFNNLERSVVDTPLNFFRCDVTKFLSDVEDNFKVDLTETDSASIRYIFTRLYWFLMIYHSDEKNYPNLYSFFNKMTTEHILVNIRSIVDSTYELERDNEDKVSEIEWYSLLKHKLISTHIQLPDDVHELSKCLHIKEHMDDIEEKIPKDFLESNIQISLRGLYNAYNTYLALGIVVPLYRNELDAVDMYIRPDIKDRLVGYVQYSDFEIHTQKNPIHHGDRRYVIRFPVAISYGKLVDCSLKDRVTLSFDTTIPIKQLLSYLDNENYHLESIYGESSIYSSEHLMDNPEKTKYTAYIVTTETDNVMNVLKVREALPNDITLSPADPSSDKFHSLLKKLKL